MYIPVHETLSLSNVYPGRQLHWNEPSVFVHSCRHGEGFIAHSFTSKREIIFNIYICT